MRKLVATEYLTLDGVMSDPGGGDKTRHGGWSFQFWSDEAAKFKFDELIASDALLLGRVTYEGFAQAWPTMKDEGGFADRMNSMPKYVVSRTLEKLSWNNSRLINGNVAEEVSKLKQQPGQDILIAGSADLVNLLMRYDLIDEYRLMVHPVILGSGKRLFNSETDMKVLRLVDTKKFNSGILVLTYEPAEKEVGG
jgi:dihydrofolate reductase